jgi:uncharacterized protein (DUF924 family)
MYHEVLNFWFEEIEPKMWFASDAGFDQLVRQRFLSMVLSAAQGELFDWRKEPEGRLAEIIVLDQFSRNIFRKTPAAFAQDPQALILAQEAVGAGIHTLLSPKRCAFLLMPYMHSESRKIHIEAEQLFRDFAPSDNFEFELKHKAIIDRFGRYPHRNRILGRVSTDEELDFLKLPGSGF